jgi:hypothetical protein
MLNDFSACLSPFLQSEQIEKENPQICHRMGSRWDRNSQSDLRSEICVLLICFLNCGLWVGFG